MARKTSLLLLALACCIIASNGKLQLMDEITLPDGHIGDQFGSSIVIRRNVAYIGAPGMIDDSGAVFILERVGPMWDIASTIVPAQSELGGYFGHGIAATDDWLAIGQPNADYYTGVVDMFALTRGGLTWAQAGTLAPSLPRHSFFGYDVDLSGNTLVVGAYGYNSSRGVAMVYDWAGTWTETAVLADSWSGPGDHFGFSVAVEGDVAVVGSWCTAHYGLLCSGSAKVFERHAGCWGMRQVLTPGVPATGGRFGYAVDMVGATIVVSMPGSVTTARGSVTVFTLAGTRWEQAQLLTGAAEGTDPDAFGFSIAVSRSSVVVGAPTEGGMAGALYLFTGQPGAYRMDDKARGPTSEHRAMFGSSVAADGDHVAAWSKSAVEPASVFTYIRK